jgi:hypothetical protein
MGPEPAQGFPVYYQRLAGSSVEGLCNASRTRGKKSKDRRYRAFPGQIAARCRFNSVRGGSSRCLILFPVELFPSKRIALCWPEPWLQAYNPHLLKLLVQSGIAVGESIVGVQT